MNPRAIGVTVKVFSEVVFAGIFGQIDRPNYFHPNRLSVLSTQTTALLQQRKGKFSLSHTDCSRLHINLRNIGAFWGILSSSCQRRIENIPPKKDLSSNPIPVRLILRPCRHFCRLDPLRRILAFPSNVISALLGPTYL